MDEVASDAPLMYHPVRERGDDAWFPSNQVGQVASLISHSWEDIVTLMNVRKERESDYEKKLLFKYVIIELRSVVENMDCLQSLIFQVIKGNSSGYISSEQIQILKTLFKTYHSSKKQVFSDLIRIRNNIGAHRGNHSWLEIIELWDKLDPEPFRPLFDSLPKLFNYIAKLDIFDWTRKPKDDGSIEIFCGGLYRPEP